MKVNFMWSTLEAEYQIAFAARGSNPSNQENPEFEKLFRYCLRNGHWSPFQMANMSLQFETSLAIAGQVKRHWSISICEPADIQETSMRYMDPFEQGWKFQEIELRKEAKSNRQSSTDPLYMSDDEAAQDMINVYYAHLNKIRSWFKEMGIANETLRMIYPQSTTTRFFLNGSARSWIHYFQQRIDEHAQLEHQKLALLAYTYFKNIFPTIASICEKEGIIKL